MNATEAQNRLKRELESEKGLQIFIDLDRSYTYSEEDFQALKEQTLEMIEYRNRLLKDRLLKEK